jgi:hypothetical protein
LVANSNNYGKNGNYNELVTGAYKPTYNWAGPHGSLDWLIGCSAIQSIFKPSGMILLGE